MRNIGKNIKAIRQSKDMTQEALAEALFVTRQTISNYENGRSKPDLDMLLKIAEVLHTDVNTVIYGPPPPQNKASAWRWTVISLVALVIIWTMYFVNRAVFNEGFRGYIYSARLINMEAVLPAAMFLLGWTSLHLLSQLCGFSQVTGRRTKPVRIILLALGCILAAVPIPYIIYHGVAFYRSLTAGSVNMSFPYIPVLQETFMTILRIIDHASPVYSILGGLFWLLGLPRIQKTSQSSETA